MQLTAQFSPSKILGIYIYCICRVIHCTIFITNSIYIQVKQLKFSNGNCIFNYKHIFNFISILRSFLRNNYKSQRSFTFNSVHEWIFLSFSECIYIITVKYKTPTSDILHCFCLFLTYLYFNLYKLEQSNQPNPILQ